MHTLVHLTIAIIIALLLGLIGFPLVIFILASVLIDIDHILEFYGLRRKKKFFLNPFNFQYERLQQSIHVFHTFEVLIMLLIFSYFFQIISYIFLAFSIHLVIDAIGNILNKNYRNKNWIKYWSMYYYIKNKKIYNKENF